MIDKSDKAKIVPTTDILIDKGVEVYRKQKEMYQIMANEAEAKETKTLEVKGKVINEHEGILYNESEHKEVMKNKVREANNLIEVIFEDQRT